MVSEVLVTLYNLYKKKTKKVFSMNITLGDLAYIVGTATETTIRTLNDFKEEGLIDIKAAVLSSF